MSNITPIKRISVGEQVFEQLKMLLAQGQWRQGERLPSENELAGQFGVSRITVRQALQRLGTLGLIETRLGEGSFVKEVEPGDSMNALIPAVYLSQDALFQILEFREIIEIQSAALAARRATPEGVERLRELLVSMQECSGNAKAFGELDLEFHIQLGRMTLNDLVVKTQAILRATLQQAMDDIVLRTGFEPGIRYHGRLIEAVEGHDEALAMQLMREHLENNKAAYQTKEREETGNEL